LAEQGRDAPVGYFCISAVSTYEGNGDFADLENLELVPRETHTMRNALTQLGLVELFHREDGELTHDQLQEKLAEWEREYDPEDPPAEKSTLVVYCTGHGRVDETFGWQLIPPVARHVQRSRWVVPMQLIDPVLKRKDVSQVILILDACFAGAGAIDTVVTSLKVAPNVGSSADLWVVAAATRAQQAKQMVLAPAFADALRQCANLELTRPYLDPSRVTDTAAAALRRKGVAQVPWVAAGYQAGGCLALPNPRYMPREAPAWIEPRWSAPARGVSAAGEPGWYFTGRDDVLQALAGHLGGESGRDSRPVVLTGGAGTGKTAVLARLLTTATSDRRRRLPPVARRGYLPSDDAEIIAVDATGADVSGVAEELAQRLELPVADAAGVVTALGSRTGPHRLMIDHVDRAADPAALISELVQPLSAVASVRLVVAARPGLTASLSGFRPVELTESSAGVRDTVETYVKERLRYELEVPDGGKTGELAHTVAAVSAFCAGNFSAAVVAVDTLLRRRRAGLPTAQATGEARQAAYRRLDRLCRSVLADARGEDSSRYVDELIDCLSGACSYSPDGWLTSARWADLARRLTGLDYRAADIDAVAEQALAFLNRQTVSDGTLIWRPRYGYVPPGSGLARHDVIEHLLNEIRQAEPVPWSAEQPGVLAILLGAAVGDDRFAALLDDGELLLAAQATTVSRTLKASQARVDGRRRVAVWGGVPVKGEARDRAFLLRLRAARSGLGRLASSLNSGRPHPPLAVNWAIRVSLAERRSPVTRLALAAAPGGLRLVSAHDDGSVSWWDGSTGQELQNWPGLRPHATAVASLATAQTDSGLVTIVATGDGGTLCWAPAETSPRRLGEPATSVALHSSGLAALVDGRVVRVVDVTARVADRSCILPAEVVAADIAGRADNAMLWLVDLEGRVWRWDLLDSARRQPSLAGPSPPVSLLGCSREGSSAVVVDLHGDLLFPARPWAVRRDHRNPDVQSVALNERWLVLGGGTDRDSGWLELHAATGAPGERWPMDGVPRKMGISGDALLVGTVDGLASIRLPDPGAGFLGR
jgi:hypothetical protein